MRDVFGRRRRRDFIAGVLAGATPTLPTLTGEIAGWSVHEDYAAKVFQDTGKTTLAATDGDVIGAVVPLTGAVDATQGTTADKPLLRTDANGINGHWAAQFDGINDFWDITGISAASGAKTFYVVHSPTTISGGNRSFVDVEIGRMLFFHLGSPGLTGYFQSSYINIAAATLGVQIMSLTINATTGELFRNGTSLGTGASVNVALGGTALIGSNFAGTGAFYQGLIGEIHVYNAEHSTAERQEMEAYLSALWGITVA